MSFWPFGDGQKENELIVRHGAGVTATQLIKMMFGLEDVCVQYPVGRYTT